MNILENVNLTAVLHDVQTCFFLLNFIVRFSCVPFVRLSLAQNM